MEKLLIVINCKALKFKLSGLAEKVYMKSKLFRTQLNFIKTINTDYVILSAYYGIVFPKQVIQYYDVSLSRGTRIKTSKILTPEEKKEWVDKVVHHFVWKNYSKIIFLISNPYWKPIKHIINIYPRINIKRIKQQVNIGLNINKYEEASIAFSKGKSLKECCSIISTQYKSKNPEIRRWFYHPVHGKFFGYARELVKRFPEVDGSNLCRVSLGKNKQTVGWVIDEQKVPYLQFINGKWRLLKPCKDKPLFKNFTRTRGRE